MTPFKNIYQLLKEAYSLLKNKKYSDAILILERVISTGIREPYPLLLLAVAYLFSNKLNKISIILNRIKVIDPAYMPYIQFHAFLQLKSGINYEIVMDIYIDLLTSYPADPHLNRGRKLLSNADDFVEFQKSARVQDFVHITSPPRALKKYKLKIRNRFNVDHIGEKGIENNGKTAFPEVDLLEVKEEVIEDIPEKIIQKVKQPVKKIPLKEIFSDEVSFQEMDFADKRRQEKNNKNRTFMSRSKKEPEDPVGKTSKKSSIRKKRGKIETRRRHNLLKLYFLRFAKAVIILVFCFVSLWAAIEYDAAEHSIKFIRKVQSLLSERNDIKTIDLVNITENNYNLISKMDKSKNKGPVFFHSPGEISTEFEKAKFLIKKKRYNKSLSLLNRIYNSNVNFSVKDKVDFLVRFILKVDERFYEKIPYKKIAKSPDLYRGYSVNWNGLVRNLKKSNDKYTFTLYVDYKSRKKHSGIAEVFCENLSGGIVNKEKVEVDAVFYNKVGKDGTIYIVAHDVRKI